MSCGHPIDRCTDPQAEMRFLNRNVAVLRQLKHSTHFSMCELQGLAVIFYRLLSSEGHIDEGVSKALIEEFLHSSLDMLNRQLAVRMISSQAVKRPFNVVDLEQWISLLSIILKGTRDEKIDYCFKVYDYYSSGKLTKYLMTTLLENCTARTPKDDETSEEIIRDLLEIIIKKFDKDHDGVISLDDFRATCKEEPKLMEVFGPCLPSPVAVRAFMATYLTKHKL